MESLIGKCPLKRSGISGEMKIETPTEVRDHFHPPVPLQSIFLVDGNSLADVSTKVKDNLCGNENSPLVDHLNKTENQRYIVLPVRMGYDLPSYRQGFHFENAMLPIVKICVSPTRLN